MRILAIAAFVTPLLAGAALAAADKPIAKDQEAITQCLAKLDKQSAGLLSYDQCISVVVDLCIKGDQSNEGQAACFAREQTVWEAILNVAYKTTRAALEEKQRLRLRDMQRAWMRSRDLTCAFYDDYFQGSMAIPMVASCTNRETARRAIFLWIFARDAKSNK